MPVIPNSAGLRLPEECRVRLIDLDPGVGALISMDEEGFANIYLNARYSRERQLEALRHELAHLERGDIYSDEDIRTVEREADRAARGETRREEAPAVAGPFGTGELRRSGRGLYMPVGEGIERAARALSTLEARLDEACRWFDVLQTPPLVPVARLNEAYRGMDDADVAFIAPEDGGRAAALRFCCDRGGEEARASGALFFGADGAVKGAVAALNARHEDRAFQITVDLRPRGGALAVGAIYRRIDGGDAERVYG